MISQDHKHIKHGNLTKSGSGEYARREVAVYGTTCIEIEKLVAAIRNIFTDNNIAFLDADHHTDSDSAVTHINCTTHAGHALIKKPGEVNKFQLKFLLNDADLVLVNGNHFHASEQIIVCDESKRDSLYRRKDQLSNVVLILGQSGQKNIPQYIASLIGEKVSDIPFLQITDWSSIENFIRTRYLNAPPLNALILTGGRSTRMGRDKSKMIFHDVDQSVYLTALAAKAGLVPYLSVRRTEDAENKNHIVDRVNDIGPLGGIISAFMEYPDHAWLVMACDMPVVSAEVLQYLITGRNPSSIATAFKNPENEFPEPLLAIWEPKSYQSILNFLSTGYSCPRKVLINSNTYLLEVPHPEILTNVNTPDDEIRVRELIKNMQS